MDIRVEGGNQLRQVARGLRNGGAPGRGIRRDMRVAITSATKPMKAAVQQHARAIPAKGPESTGLRAAIAAATAISIKASGSTAVVKLWVNPARMPQGKRNLPAYMEGTKRNWKHPVYDSDRKRWSKKAQPAHRYFAPAVQPRIAGVRVAVAAAVERAVARIESEL